MKEMQMTDKKVEVRVPPLGEYVMDRTDTRLYLAAQGLLQNAISVKGNDLGISMVMSGITRELRRHMSYQDAAELLRGFAATIEAARDYDIPD
jgi:hypothetical protein